MLPEKMAPEQKTDPTHQHLRRRSHRANKENHGVASLQRVFFRQMPNALLARYFHARRIFGNLDFRAMKEIQSDEFSRRDLSSRAVERDFAVWSDQYLKSDPTSDTCSPPSVSFQFDIGRLAREVFR